MLVHEDEAYIFCFLTCLYSNVMLALSNSGGRMELTTSKARYLFVIYELGAGKNNPVRSVDIANRIGISRASVAGMLQDLLQSGMVSRTECGAVLLTKDGNDVAMDLYLQYRTLLRFFMQNLQIDGPQAREDSISAIVNLSPSCIRQFSKYIRTVKGHHSLSE